MTVYRGWRVQVGKGEGDTIVTADGEPLPWRLDLENKSPTGLNWGYAGSGPAQCALALLAHALKGPYPRTGDRRALKLYQDFKWGVVCGLPDQWVLTDAQVREWIWVHSGGKR